MEKWILRMRPFEIKKMIGRLKNNCEKDQIIETEEHIVALIQQHLLNLFIEGIVTINNADLTPFNENYIEPITKTLTVKEKWALELSGSGLRTIMNIDGINWRRTRSIDPHEINNILGIEAAVAILFFELQKVLSFDGTYIAPVHIMNLVDTMTYRGYLMPMNRHGFNRTDMGPLTRMSFEQTGEVLLQTGAFAEEDSTNNIISSIIFGRQAAVGTNLVDILDYRSGDLLYPEVNYLTGELDEKISEIINTYMDDDPRFVMDDSLINMIGKTIDTTMTNRSTEPLVIPDWMKQQVEEPIQGVQRTIHNYYSMDEFKQQQYSFLNPQPTKKKCLKFRPTSPVLNPNIDHFRPTSPCDYMDFD